ncbi:aldehyde dehydrogenase family protein [Leptolyngbya sp. FACHB-261]|uniref:aldehyde dehydrogenase family protein n=1 Tax=Leptolyngbya sp. FACHB-261 TaxID=2692806 RepID=UPI001689DF05|nr:aldehyde dehydrogenase family protein [Leptolyngbya sp. FACHB-261]MBD2099464.1 aldehyde dehydrogenase [Leptolyngbya sp. FACHB-261]
MSASQTAAVVATSSERLEAMLSQLSRRKDAWLQVPIPERLAYLEACLKRVEAVAEPWVDACCQAKGLDSQAPLAGEEWLTGPVSTVMYLRLLQASLKSKGQSEKQSEGQPTGQVDGQLTHRPDGQAVVRVFPQDWLDRLVWLGFEAQIWLEPGQPSSQGAIYRQKRTSGKLALVLGAGNISSIGPLDALHKLFVEDEVVLLKLNPVNEYLGPWLEASFAPLIEAGFLGIAYGGAELGSYLCSHRQIESIHITGSQRTHDAIVWGSTGQEQQARKSTQTPQLDKPITSELGCVTPVLVVPGQWSEADLAFQARQVASMVVHNASFNCAAAKVLVTAEGWPQREAFLAQLRRELAAIAPRKAYYPGAHQRYQAFLARYPQAEALSPGSEEVVPWTLIPNVPPQASEYALNEEAFCGVLTEVPLPVAEAEAFLDQAVAFANSSIWGTLSCTILIDPTTAKKHAGRLDRAIANLRYGGIGINVWSGVLYGLMVTSWGAFPGQPLTEIQSGRGTVHNTLLFDHPQKSILWAPFRIQPTPAWFANHKNLRQLGKRLLALEVARVSKKGLSLLPEIMSVLAAGLRG